jgi:hypothetical protein
MLLLQEVAVCFDLHSMWEGLTPYFSPRVADSDDCPAGLGVACLGKKIRNITPP